jgi:DNA-binding phage protein
MIPVLALASVQSPVHVAFAGFGPACAAIAGWALWLTRRLSYGAYRPWTSELFHLAAALPQMSGLGGVVGLARRFRVSAKRAGRPSGWINKAGYAVVAALGTAALARAGQLALTGHGSALVWWSAAFVALNTALVTHLLVMVARYERRSTTAAHARLAPEALYRYLAFRYAEPDPTPSVTGTLTV